MNMMNDLPEQNVIFKIGLAERLGLHNKKAPQMVLS